MKSIKYNCVYSERVIITELKDKECPDSKLFVLKKLRGLGNVKSRAVFAFVV